MISRSAAGSLLSADRSVTFDVAFRSAPFLASSVSTAARLDAAANIAGVSPRTGSFAFTLAPPSISRVTASVLPEAAASISAVVPFDVALLASAPDFSSGAITDGAAALGGENQRRVGADARRRAHVGAGEQQRLHQVRVVFHRRPVQRGHAVALRGVDVGRLLQQRAHRVAVALHRRVGHRRGRRGVQHDGQRKRAKAEIERFASAS